MYIHSPLKLPLKSRASISLKPWRLGSVFKHVRRCSVLEPSAGARIPPLWANLRGKPPRCGHRAPRCRRWSYASSDQHPLSNTTFAYHFMIHLSYPTAEINGQWLVLHHQVQLNVVECNLWISNYSTSLYLFCLQSRFHSGRTLAVRYGYHGASARWSPRKQPRGLGWMRAPVLDSNFELCFLRSYVNKWILMQT